MKLNLTHPLDGIFDPSKIVGIPNKHSQFSGYYLLGMAETVLSGGGIAVDRYVCFTNIEKDQVWIEKLTHLRVRGWFVIEDTVKIEDDEEFNLLLQFFKEKNILDPKS